MQENSSCGENIENELDASESTEEDQYERDSDEESGEFSFSQSVKFTKTVNALNRLLEDSLIKGQVRAASYNALSPKMQEVVMLFFHRVLSKSGLSKVNQAFSSGNPPQVTFKLEDYRSQDREKNQIAKHRRLDGKKKLIMSCALKRMRKNFIDKSQKLGKFKQSTDPNKHLLQTEINAKFFKQFLDPKGEIKIEQEVVERKFSKKTLVQKQYSKNGEHNKIFSLVHRGGITKEWINIILRCSHRKRFLNELISVIKSKDMLEEYQVKIKSMIRGLQRLPQDKNYVGAKSHNLATSETQYLEVVRKKLGSYSDPNLPIRNADGKAPLSIRELDSLRHTIVQRLEKVLQAV